MSGVLQPDGRYVYSIFQSGFRPSTWSCNNQIHSNFDITNKSIRPFLFTTLNISLYQIKCNMLSKSSKWELGFVHYITKFTILRFVISKFECTYFQRQKIQNKLTEGVGFPWMIHVRWASLFSPEWTLSVSSSISGGSAKYSHLSIKHLISKRVCA